MEPTTVISLVLPCYNENAVLELTYSTLAAAAKSWGEPIEIILVDDGSSDNTWELIEGLARRDTRVRGIKLSRNFGHQAAVGAGLEAATGDAVVVLDADLQDPPSLINEMLQKWRQGYEVVYAQRRTRVGDATYKRVMTKLFYRLLERANNSAFPRDVGDFALLDARVVETLRGFKEHSVFWRGLRWWSGYKQTAVLFDRPERARGETKYTLRKLVQLAVDGLLALSPLPPRLPLYVGAATLVFAGVCTLVLGMAKILGGTAIDWASLMLSLSLLFVAGVQLCCLGVAGEYLNRIYAEVRNRPRWIVARAIGGDSGAALKPMAWDEGDDQSRAG